MSAGEFVFGDDSSTRCGKDGGCANRYDAVRKDAGQGYFFSQNTKRRDRRDGCASQDVAAQQQQHPLISEGEIVSTYASSSVCACARVGASCMATGSYGDPTYNEVLF